MTSQRKKCLRLGLLNAQSLYTGNDELCSMLLNYDPDIIALNETWIKNCNDRFIPSMPGYILKHTPRPKSQSGGGVGFFIRKGLRTRVRPHPISELEQMWIELSIQGMRIAIGSVYRPGTKNGLKPSEATEALSESIDCFEHCDCVFILTDFNIDMLKKNSSVTREFTNFISMRNLEQLVQEPTRITNTSATLLDLVLTNVPERCSSVSVYHNRAISDHGLVLVDINIKKPKPKPKYVSVRSLHKIDSELFLKDLHSLNWQDIYVINDVDEKINLFNDLIRILYDKYAPLKRVRVKERPNPWITENMLLMMSLRDKALNRARRTNSEIHFNYYKSLRNLITLTLEREKTAYFNYYINNNYRNPTKMWSHLSKISQFNNSHPTEIPNSVNDPNEINEAFLNTPGGLEPDKDTLNFFKTNKFGGTTFNFSPTDEKQVKKIINNIKTGATGHDDVSAEMIRMTLSITLPVITHIVNVSLTTQNFPESCKLAKVIPFPKHNNVETHKDLRPISILPVMSKIIERVACAQLTNYLEAQNILPANQSGFRRGHGTATALTNVVDDAISASDSKHATFLVLLDFSRAFDCVNTELLIAKLSYYGLSLNTCLWFKSFLSGRKQYVVTENEHGEEKKSSTKCLSRGVPQGSIISPILFILFTTDIGRCIKKCDFHLYADDTQLYHSFKPEYTQNAVKLLNDDLNGVREWATNNTLVLNPSKTQYLILGSKQQRKVVLDHNPIIIIDGQNIERASKVKNLGLIIDEDLRFEAHINLKIKTAFFRLKMLYGIRNNLSEKVRLILVDSLILSLFSYCDVVYGPRIFKKTEKAIQRVQNACARFCFNIPKRSHVSPYLNEKGILNMASRRKLHYANFVYKILNDEKPEYLFRKCSRKLHARGTRMQYENTLVLPEYKTMGFKGSFRFAAAKIWNDLPPPLRLNMSQFSFKAKLKKILLENQKMPL